MGRVSQVVSVDPEKGVKVDDGSGEQYYAELFGPPGEDSPPLAGDEVSLSESDGAGEEHALGFDDTTERKAAPGERRVYARRPDGTLACEVWLKGDGSIAITNLLAQQGGTFEIREDGTVVINGVEFSPTGSVTVPPGATLGGAVDLITHVHGVAAVGSPTTPPQGPPP
jgi:hypothetical protein